MNLALFTFSKAKKLVEPKSSHHSREDPQIWQQKV